MPEHAPADDGLEDAVAAFLAAYRRSRSRLQRDPGLVGLTSAQFEVLRAAGEHGAGGVGAVAVAAGLAQPPTTRALAKLEAASLVVRRRGEDRRITELALTEEGRRLLAHHRRRLRAAAATIRKELPPKRRADAAALLRLVGDALDRLP
jgi:DNA-binding MarR family transcriptional regulator